MAESFFATLETELLALVGPLTTTADAKQRVISFIEGFYNTRRLHSQLSYVRRASSSARSCPQPSTAIHNSSVSPQTPLNPPGDRCHLLRSVHETGSASLLRAGAPPDAVDHLQGHMISGSRGRYIDPFVAYDLVEVVGRVPGRTRCHGDVWQSASRP